MASLRVAVFYAALALLLQLWLARVLAFLPLGTRAQAAGAGATSLVLLAVGFLAGLQARPRPKKTGSLRSLFGLLSPAGETARLENRARHLPVRIISITALLIGAAGLAGYFVVGSAQASLGTHLPFASWLLSTDTLVKGGVARAVFATDATGIAGFLLLGMGAMLGLNTRPWTVLTSILGVFALSVLTALGSYLARFASYEATTIMALSVAASALAAGIVGFSMAWIRQRLAFVELSLVTLFASYSIFLVAVVGPASLTRSFNLPEEQIFLALSIIPAIAFFALMTVGSSIGFLLHGGGRFDPGFRFELSVALRYLKAHGRDGMVGIVTKIAVVGVMLGVTALVVVLSVMSGFENDLKRKILGAHAHIVVGKQGDDFTEYKKVEEEVARAPSVDTAAAFVLGDAMISTDLGLSGTVVKGIDPRSAGATKDLAKNMIKGSLAFLSDPTSIPGAQPSFSAPKLSGSASSSVAAGSPFDFAVPTVGSPPKSTSRSLPGILIGRELSATLRAYVGDTVKLVSPVSEEIGPMGPTPKLRRFRVAGIFYSGMYEYDAKFTYVDIAEAQRFFGVRGRATGVELKVKDVDDTAQVVDSLKRILGGYPYTIRDWREMNKELFSALLLEKLAMFIGLAKIIMVASFLIVATLVMIVLQRGKEIAILKSIGASDASIMKVFVVQGVVVGVGGALLGVMLGLVLCVLSRYVPLDEKKFYIERLPVVIDGFEVLAVAACAIVMSYLATIYPAITAAGLRPVEGLRDD